MIVEERMQTYINSLDMGNTPFLQELETKALADRVPIIRRDMQSFMRMLLALKQPKRILEVGTAVGFSTLHWENFLCVSMGRKIWKLLP